MSTLDKLLTKWKLWINRDRTFQADELKELQSHLMEEINFLVNQEGLSEEEAFHQAVSLVGDREGLDQEYVKEKSVPGKVIHWAKVHPWSVCSTILILVLISSYFAWYRPLAQENSRLRNDLGYIKTYPGPFKPLEGTDVFGQPIANPRLEWKKEINYIDDGPPGKNIDLSVTQDGDVFIQPSPLSYTSSNKAIMSIISSKGQLICCKEFYRKNYLEIQNTKKELFQSNNQKPAYFFINSNNHLCYYKDGTEYIVGPNKMLYVINLEGLITSMDSTGKARWQFQIPIKNLNIEGGRNQDYFFDNDSNLHIIARYNDKSSILFTISSTGDLLNQVDLPKEFFSSLVIEDYAGSLNMYHGSILENQIFMKKVDIDDIRKIRSIDAYGFDGELKWFYSQDDSGMLTSQIFLDNNSNLFLTCGKQKSNRKYLQSISNMGKLLWEKEIKIEPETRPFIDLLGNIYFGSDEVTVYTNEYLKYMISILCLNPDGSMKWSWETDKSKNLYLRSSLVFGPNGSIYFIVQEDFDKLFCVKLASNK